MRARAWRTVAEKLFHAQPSAANRDLMHFVPQKRQKKHPALLNAFKSF
jgi:hypothetical protein